VCPPPADAAAAAPAGAAAAAGTVAGAAAAASTHAPVATGRRMRGRVHVRNPGQRKAPRLQLSNPS